MKTGSKSDIVNYRLARANETLNEIEFLIQQGYLNNAVNRLYYASFYAVVALLTQYDISTKTHNGTRQMFGLHFIQPGIISKASGSFYRDIFDKRQTGDYEDFIVFEEDEVKSFLLPARNLLKEIEQIIANK